jgi:hypothetical protein
MPAPKPNEPIVPVNVPSTPVVPPVTPVQTPAIPAAPVEQSKPVTPPTPPAPSQQKPVDLPIPQETKPAADQPIAIIRAESLNPENQQNG